MIIRWLGHASFIIESQGKKLRTDPFEEKLGYSLNTEEIDVVTVSHEHWDHNAVDTVKGQPKVIKGLGEWEVEGFKIAGIASFHDKNNGKKRGSNIIYTIAAEGIKIVHLGDLGHLLDEGQLALVGNADILMIPVGGNYTIDAEEACRLAEMIQPTIIIPMHFQTPHLTIKLAPVEEFTARFEKSVKRPFLEIKADELKEKSGIIVLDYPG